MLLPLSISEDNVNITASGDGTFAVKNNGTQEITVTVGTSTAIGTYNIQIKAGNTVLLTDTFEVTAKPVAHSECCYCKRQHHNVYRSW